MEAAIDGTVTGEWLSSMFCGGRAWETSAKFVRDDSPDGTWSYAHVVIGELLCHMESMELAGSVPADGTLTVPFECVDGTTRLLPMARMAPAAYATDDFQDASFCVDLQRLPDVMDDIGRYVAEIGQGYLRETDRRELRQRSLSRIFIVANRIWDPRCSSWSDWVAYVSLSPWYNPRWYSFVTWPVIARPVHGDGLADILGRLGVLSSRILVNTFLRPGRNGYEWCPETQSWVDAQDLRPWWKSPEEYDADLMGEGLWEEYWMARSYDDDSWRPPETEVSYREERAERASQLFGRYEDAYDDGL